MRLLLVIDRMSREIPSFCLKFIMVFVEFVLLCLAPSLVAFLTNLIVSLSYLKLVDSTVVEFSNIIDFGLSILDFIKFSSASLMLSSLELRSEITKDFLRLSMSSIKELVDL